uniref:Uncharacterized protein n=1 Tax=Octopus bimaculoides TaxID=37653 RepID=A0A0L8GX87_OCTBM
MSSIFYLVKILFIFMFLSLFLSLSLSLSLSFKHHLINCYSLIKNNYFYKELKM